MGIITSVIFTCIALVAFFLAFSTTLMLAECLSTQSNNHVFHPETIADESDDILFRILNNCCLLLLFVAQHSLMATWWWKSILQAWGLAPVQRSFYILATAWILQILMTRWQPFLATPIWLIDTQSGVILWTFFFLLHVCMWIFIYGSTLTMDFAELVGLKQVYYYSQGWEQPMTFKSRGTKLLYDHMRHPGTSSFLVILWIHPVMTLGRFLLAAYLTLYLLFGFSVTEADYLYVESQVSKKKITVVTRMEFLE